MKKMMKSFGALMIMVLAISLCACGESTPKHVLEIESQEFATVHDDYKVVCVYTTYTNNSGESAMPADWKSVKAFQNGVELSPIVFTGEKYNDYIQCDTSVQDGTTAKVVWMFQVEDDSEVTVEVKDL